MNRATALLDWAFSQPGKDCIVTDDERYSFDDVRTAVLGAACLLSDRVRPGTRVGLFIDSTPNFVIYQYAVFHLGGVVTPINRALKEGEVRALVSRLGLSMVIADARLDVGSAVLHVVEGEFDAPGYETAVAPANLSLDAPALLLQTSGSTGEPKGVLLTQRNLSANYDASYRWIGVGKDDRILLTLPIFNTYALNQGINMLAMSGASMRLLRRFSAEAVATALTQEAPTFLPLVPTMLSRLRQSDVRYEAPIKVGIGAAPSPSKLTDDAWTVFPHSHLYFGYGLTEATAITSLNHVGTLEDHVDDLSSSGSVVSGVDVRIDHPSGEDDRGEILIKGDPVLTAYVGTDDEIPVVDGWLHTGDVGRLEEGRLTIVDRLRELIIRGGQNIYPGEIERVLTNHPSVLEAAVVGRPDEDFGELPIAFVVLRRAHEVSAQELQAWTRAELAAFKVPTEVIIADSLPKTATGKIQKRELRTHVG